MLTAKILDNDEFDRLDYPDVDVSLGLYDPSKDTMFIRNTGSSVFDAMTLAHELEHAKEHALEKYSDHLKDGVYYKKFGETMSSIGSIAGPVMMAIPGMQPFGMATMAGAGFGKMRGQQRAQKQAMGQQQQEQQQQQSSMMDQFRQLNPSSTPPIAGSGNVGMGDGPDTNVLGGQGGGLMDRLRKFISPQSRFGNYSGRGGAY